MYLSQEELHAFERNTFQAEDVQQSSCMAVTWKRPGERLRPNEFDTTKSLLHGSPRRTRSWLTLFERRG